MQHKIDLDGLFPPIPTAFDNNENLNVDEFVKNVQKWNEFNYRGIVILGSNGEFPFLLLEEKLKIIKLTKDNISSKKLLIAGAGCEGTGMCIDMCHKFYDYGVDAVLIHTPHFFKSLMRDNALEHHYKKIADNSPLPIILYNVPSNTGIELSSEAIIKLASHPNIIGLKESGGDVQKMGDVIEGTKRQDFQVLAGSASCLADAIIKGAVGGVCAIGNILPKETLQLAVLAKIGDIDQAKALQTRITQPNLAVTRKFGVPALKHMLDKFGFYGGPTRSPLLPLTEHEQILVENEFLSNGFHW